MSVQQKIALAQLDTQAFALMGRMHVILRRESGRVTDIEYMRHDPAYCRHVLELAEQLDNPTLLEICARLRDIFFGDGGLFMISESKPLLAPRPAPVSMQTASTPSAGRTAQLNTIEVESSEQTYVGRLR